MLPTIWGGSGGEVGEDGEGDDRHHDAGRVGLAEGVLIEEADFLAQDAEDQAPDELVDGVVEQAGDGHGQQRHQNNLGEDGVGGVERGGQRRDQLLVGTLSGLGSLQIARGELTGIELRLDALGLALETEGGDGVTDEALGAHDERCEHRELFTPGVLRHALHLQRGDHAAGEDRRADEGEAAVDDQLADEEHGNRDSDAGHSGDDDGAPLCAEVTEFDGRAEVNEQQRDQQARHAQQGGIGEHRGREDTGPEAQQEDHRGHQQHGYDCFRFGGDHVSDGEHHKDDRGSEGCVHVDFLLFKLSKSKN